MIRINLGRKSAAAGAGQGKQSLSDKLPDLGHISEVVSDSEGSRTLGVKLAILFLGPIMLLAYQEIVIPEKKAEIKRLRSNLDGLVQKNNQAAGAVEEIKKFETDQEKLQAQILAFTDLSKDRVREVRVMDYIQREIPERVWLQRMEMNNGRLLLVGLATEDTEMTSFMEILQRSAHLRNVSLVRSSEVVLPNLGNLRRFEIACQLEKPE